MGNFSLGTLLSDALKKFGFKQSHFAVQVDIDPSFLSRVIRGEKSIPLAILDKAIALLDLNQNEIYSLYMAECWQSKTHALELMKKFLLHCNKMGYKKHTKMGLDILLEKGGCLETIFSIGDKLFNDNQKEESLQFFDSIIFHEDDKKSYILALAYFRKLMVYYHNNLDKSEEVALSFCEYLDYIPDTEILEAHYRVIGTFRLKRKWEHVIRYGEKLVQIAKYMNRQDYVGDGLIKMAIAAREMGDYPLAIRYHEECKKIELGNYSRWAYGNLLITLITAGEVNKIDDLYSFCSENKDLSFEYLEFLLESAVKNDRDDVAEAIFTEFPEQIEFLNKQKSERSIYARHQINFTFSKAVYHLKNGDKSGIEEAISAAEMAVKLRLQKQALQSLKVIFVHAEKNSNAYQKALLLMEEIT